MHRLNANTVLSYIRDLTSVNYHILGDLEPIPEDIKGSLCNRSVCLWYEATFPFYQSAITQLTHQQVVNFYSFKVEFIKCEVKLVVFVLTKRTMLI